MIHNKLVRDFIPTILKECRYHLLEPTAYEEALQDKLQEEVREYLTAKKEHRLEELADILEVLHALTLMLGKDFSSLDAKRIQKRQLKGGFEKGVFLESSSSPCLFCDPPPESILKRFQHCFALQDAYPISPGHLLIIPYEHVETWFHAPEWVQKDMYQALEVMKKTLDHEREPDGFNIGMNCHEAAGQSVMHLHMHLIPRYQGDVKDPKGGIRGVIPGKQKY